jgi:hypothetical protein
MDAGGAQAPPVQLAALLELMQIVPLNQNKVGP